MENQPDEHLLQVEPAEGCTVGACSCGRWRREADLSTLRVTGRSREDALRSAHASHAAAE
jgi:hypothetical protein